MIYEIACHRGHTNGNQHCIQPPPPTSSWFIYSFIMAPNANIISTTISTINTNTLISLLFIVSTMATIARTSQNINRHTLAKCDYPLSSSLSPLLSFIFSIHFKNVWFITLDQFGFSQLFNNNNNSNECVVTSIQSNSNAYRKKNNGRQLVMNQPIW